MDGERGLGGMPGADQMNGAGGGRGRLGVEARGGDLDRTLPVVATRRGVTAIAEPKGKRYYVVPEQELLRADAA